MGTPLSIVIPTLNEATGIASTIESIRLDELRRAGFDTEILIVDGGSEDGTIEVARKLGAKVIVEPRRGYGRAYKTGFSRLKSDIIVTIDGDGSYPGDLIPRLVRLLSRNRELDFITTNRFSQRKATEINLLHRLGNFILSLTTRVLFKIKIKDSQSGMWIFRRSALKEILPVSDGMPFSEEIKVKAFLRLKGVIEVPIPFRKRIGSAKLKVSRDGFKNLLFLFKLFAVSRTRGNHGW
jgi:glycosyltransferase involved in cell wall biosynthesis